MSVHRWLTRHYQAAAVCFGFAMLAVLIAALPILFARG